MKHYHLVPDRDVWKLTRESDGTIQYFDSKEEAVRRCSEYMIKHPARSRSIAPTAPSKRNAPIRAMPIR